MYCIKCGNKSSEGDKFCIKCGSPLGQKDVKIPENAVKKSGHKPVLRKVIYVVIFIIAFIIVFVVVRGLTQKGTNSILSSSFKEALIKQTVLKVKESVALPQQIDAATTLNDILEEPSAIRYEYTLHDIDTSKLSNEMLKNSLVPALCQNKDTRNILDKDINMEYDYKVKNSAKTFFVSISKADCL